MWRNGEVKPEECVMLLCALWNYLPANKNDMIKSYMKPTEN